MNLGMRGLGAMTVLVAAVLSGCTDVRDGAASISPDAGAPRVEVVGDTTVKRMPMFKPDGSPSPTLAGAETLPSNATRGFHCREDPLFGGLNRCGAPQTDWILNFCAVQADTMYCPQLSKSGGLAPVFTTAAVTGTAQGSAGSLPGPVPWAVELSDGTRCMYSVGMGSARTNAAARYYCDGEAGSLWQVGGGAVFTESAGGWSAQVGVDSPRYPLRTAAVRTAIFMTVE